MQLQLLTQPEGEAYLQTSQGIIAEEGSPALMRGCGSGDRKLGKQSLAFGLGAEQ